MSILDWCPGSHLHIYSWLHATALKNNRCQSTDWVVHQMSFILGQVITIGIKCGVKLTVTFDFAASDNPCSISGTGINQRGMLVFISRRQRLRQAKEMCIENSVPTMAMSRYTIRMHSFCYFSVQICLFCSTSCMHNKYHHSYQPTLRKMSIFIAEGFE